MATSRHIIHQQAIEINAMNRNTAQPLFLEISRLFNNRAKDVAGYILDKYDRESELIKIDVLDVDIGAIPFPFSEESFVKVYSEKFEEALSGMIKKQLQLAESRPQQSDSAIAKRSILHLLEQFLLTGTIAWWAGKEELKDPIRVFNALQEKEMPLLKATIMRLFPEAMVRKRLVYAFTEEHIKTVISMVQPAEQEYIVRYHARVSYLQTEHHFVRTDSTGFGKALWLFILDFLADHSGNRFNRKMFVRSTLAAIATRFNVRFEELLFFFSEALKEIPEKLRKMENLLSLLEEITLEELHPFYTKAFGQSGSDNGMTNTTLSKTAQALFFFLLNGFFPIGFQATDGTTLNSDLINTIRQTPAQVRLFFLKHGRAVPVRKRLLMHFSRESVQALVQLIEPAGSELIMSYASFVTQFQRKMNFVKTEESLFQDALWDLILTDVFAERSPVFQAKSFLIVNLQALAHRYAIEPIRLQAMLVQGTVQQDHTSNAHAALFFHLTEILSENTAVKQALGQTSLPETSELSAKNGALQIFENELSLPETKNDVQADILEQELFFPETKNGSPVHIPEKELTLMEILDSAASAISTVQKSFLLHVALHLLEFGVFPPWARAGGLSAAAFITRMRTSYSGELKTAVVYVARNRKTGVSFLQHHAPLFKTDLVFLFEKAFPEKLTVFFQELQALHTIPDVIFAQALLIALAESAERTPDLSVFFSVLLKYTEYMQRKENPVTLAFHAGTFTSLKGSAILQKAFAKAFKEQAYSGIPLHMEYSTLNFRQALAISFTDGKIPEDSQLSDYLLTWIRHYATYKQMPSGIKPPDVLSDKKLVAWALEFLFVNHKQQLQELFSSDQLSMEAQLVLSELLQRTEPGLQVRYVVEEQSRRKLIAGQQALATFDPDKPDSWQWLIKNLTTLSSENPDYTKLTTLLMQESSRARLARYISDEELKQVLEKNHLSDLWPCYRSFQEVRLVLASGHFERQHLRTKTLEFFLALFVGQIHAPRSARELAKYFIGFIVSRPDDTLAAMMAKIVRPNMIEGTSFSVHAKELMMHLSVAMHQVLRSTRTTMAIEKELRAQEGSLHIRLDAREKKQLRKELHEKTNEEITDATEQQKGKALPMGEQVYIQNAGMILLHPFIATLFARAGLTKDGVFAGEAAQSKAVQLLQYAVAGKEQEPEYELVLNKVLSGLKPEDVLIHTTDLTTEEKELINGMIHAILMQWDKMKNTSLEGFRNSFLMREAYLFQTDESWVLRIEQRGYDIILQTLPWSFGMIKFSWMNKPLIVEWN